MKKTNKAVMALSLAMKAGKLAVGYDSVENAALSGKAKLVVAVNDISERTLRNAKRVSGNTRFVEAPFGADEMQAVFGRRIVIAALTDSNFSDLFIQALNDI
ncbi:MAG: 50S ribosomal protein L7ae [Oscillospiraceae bacterium]|nr:50S ribosomal protein L7ae [Oscillospiraceae bacterium]